MGLFPDEPEECYRRREMRRCPSCTYLVVLVLLRLLLRRRGVAVAVFLALGILISDPGGASPALYFAVNLLFSSVLVMLLFRFGLLTLVVACSVLTILTYYPLTPDLSSWYAQNTVLVTLVLAAVTAYGLRVSLAGRSPYRDPVLSEGT
jgi:hypothetical protein